MENLFFLTLFIFLDILNGATTSKNHSILTPRSNNTILYVFSGSDWCSNCIQLERKVLSDTQFLDSLKTHKVELEKIDFPQRKKLPQETLQYNNSLAEKFGFDGSFPTMIVYSPTTHKYKRIVYQNEHAALFSKKVIELAATLYE
jgi:thiol-disulfide isomerase/thioredoxin